MVTRISWEEAEANLAKPFISTTATMQQSIMHWYYYYYNYYQI